jgi:hypothetical protein
MAFQHFCGLNHFSLLQKGMEKFFFHQNIRLFKVNLFWTMDLIRGLKNYKLAIVNK